MALNGDALGTLIGNAVIAANPNSGNLSQAEKDTIIDGWKLIAGEIVDYFVANAEVTTTTAGSATGVQSGPGTAPTTGSGTGGIS